MSIEAMKQALEALENIDRWLPTIGQRGLRDYEFDAICALRQAIEQAEKQEPVAWQVMVEDEALKEFPIKDMAHDWCIHQKLSGSPHSYWIRPLYTTPQPQREWVGLTDEEIDKTHETQVWDARRSYARAIEAKLKEKNNG